MSRGVLVSGVQLRAARIHRRITQEDLARRTGLDVKTIRKAESGGRIDLNTLNRLAEVLQIEPALLIGPDESTATMHARRRALLERWLLAWDACDGDALMDLYHDDAVLSLPGGPTIPFGGLYRGKAAIRRGHELAWSTCRTAPARDEDVSFLMGADVVLMQGIKGVYMPDGSIARLRCIHVFKFEGERIIHHRADYDTLKFALLLELDLSDGRMEG